MHNPEYFNYQQAAREAGLTDEQLSRLAAVLRAEEPDDDMLFELHLLRAIHAIIDGPHSFEMILRSAQDDIASAA